jgi:hypothetical protein
MTHFRWWSVCEMISQSAKHSKILRQFSILCGGYSAKDSEKCIANMVVICEKSRQCLKSADRIDRWKDVERITKVRHFYGYYFLPCKNKQITAVMNVSISLLSLYLKLVKVDPVAIVLQRFYKLVFHVACRFGSVYYSRHTTLGMWRYSIVCDIVSKEFVFCSSRNTSTHTPDFVHKLVCNEAEIQQCQTPV